MNSHNELSNDQIDISAPVKQKYITPTITVLGGVDDLTQGKGNYSKVESGFSPAYGPS